MAISGITNAQIAAIESKYNAKNLQDVPVEEREVVTRNIVKLINDNLSEPYSVYVYIYFLKNFPQLCFYIEDKETDHVIACIVGKYEEHKSTRMRGYIGMLVVSVDRRGESLGKYLIERILRKFRDLNCDDVTLETQCNNASALSLYKKFGFICLKKYKNYYNENQTGKDAFMLILGLTPKAGRRGAFLRQEALE